MNPHQGNIMELDELKSAWQILDRHLEQQSALSLHIFKQGRLDRMRSTLRPLFWGQLLQMAFGLAFIVFASLLMSLLYLGGESAQINLALPSAVTGLFGSDTAVAHDFARFSDTRDRGALTLLIFIKSSCRPLRGIVNQMPKE
jgi:hypothetical protein